MNDSRQLELFAAYLSLAIEGQAPLSRALEATPPQLNRDSVARIRSSLLAGQPLSIALRQAGFPDFFWRLVESGEKSGTLKQLLTLLFNYYELSTRFRRRLFLALLYPLTVSAAAVVFLIFSLFISLPRFLQLCDASGSPVPAGLAALNRLKLLFVSDTLVILVAFFFLLVTLVMLLFREHAEGLLYRLAGLSSLTHDCLRQDGLARFAAITGLFLRHGQPLAEAMRAGADLVAYPPLRRGLLSARSALQAGSTLPSSLARVDPVLGAVLENAGPDTAAALERFSNDCAGTVEARATAWFGILEPGLLFITGLLTLVVIVSLFAPLTLVGGLPW